MSATPPELPDDPAPWREALRILAPAAAVSVAAPTLAISLGGPGSERTVATVMALVHAAIAFAATASVLDGSSHVEGRARLAWRAVGGGVLVYALAHLAWTVAAMLGAGSGSPAWLPAFTVANLLLIGGAIALPSSGRRVDRTRRLDVAIMTTAAVCLLWVLPISRLWERSSAEGRHTAAFVTLAVVKVATVLVAMAVLARCRPDAHHETRPFAFALIVFGVADLVFASVEATAYPMGSRVADTLYNTTALLWLLVGRRLTRPPITAPPEPARRNHRLAPPETMTVIALVALAVKGQFDRSSPVVVVTLGGLLVVLAIVRLGHLEHQQRHLVASLRESARRLHDQARIDTLTGLGNRLALDERLQAIAGRRRDRRDAALFFVDVDHFKRFNDGLGHHVGDRVLVEMAGRLRDVLGDGVHRVGGDEFVAVVEGVDAASAELLAQDVVTIARAPIAVDAHEMSCTVSVGLAHLDADRLAAADPRDGQGVHIARDGDHAAFADALLRQADLALYGAKERGRDQWSVYDPRLQQRANGRLQLQHDLHRAVEQGLIEVLYRPVVELSTRRVVGATAAPRWRSERHGVLHPDTFLDALGDGGLLPQFDALVLGDLARTARAAADLRWVCLALSRPEIVHPGFTDCLLAALRDAGTAPERVRLAVTEETVIDPAARPIIEELRAHDVQLVVHKFGTGPSSLLSLGDYPASTIAVDRSFVDGLGRRHDDTVIVNAVAGLTSDLGLELAADGVCEEHQAQLLQEMGCALAQGRLFGEPVPLDHARLVGSGVRW